LRKRHPGVRSLQNTKPSGPKKKHPQTNHNQNTWNTEQTRILKASKEKRQSIYKGKPIKVMADFSTQTLNIRRSWKDIIQAMKESNCQPRLIYPAKL
jgi:hypothetical protein